MLFSASTLATVSVAALIGLSEATSSSQSNSSSYLDGYTTPSTVYPGLTAGLGDPRVILPNTGVQVQGIVPADYPNINAFLGIPYGQPPVGALRFTPPQAYDYQSYHSSNTSGKVRSGRQSVNGDILADQLPPSCMQWLGNDTGIYNVDVTEFSIRGPISEDCLTLSMWTPRNASAGTYPNGGGYGNGTGKAELLPVLVFIPGGAFTTGGQNVPYQIPEKLVARRQDVIVVTINYRLNIFGFPNSKGLNEQNLGLLDQRVALEWVANNVEAFGGDPKRVVLWGQSAGAASVDYYAHTYPTDPLVRGFAMDSGTTYLGCCRSQDSNQTQFSYVASVFNCANSDPAAELACMRTVPADLLTNFLREHANAATAPSLSFDPIVDDKVVFANYTQRVASGGLAKVPAIIGSNTEDSGSISLFLCPLLKTISNRALANQTTYRYLYGGNFTNISPKPSFGAYHSSELPLLFGTYGDFRGNSSALEIQTSEAMQDAYVSFAASGAPAGWPAYDAMRTGGLPTSRLVKVWARNGTAQQVLMDAGAGEKALEDGCATTALTYPDS